MAILTKTQLSASNASSFPDNTSGAITPTILRDFNTSIIDTLVDSLDTGSFTTTSSFNAYTSSNDTKWSTLGTKTGSYVTTDTSQVITGPKSFNPSPDGSIGISMTGATRLAFGSGGTQRISSPDSRQLDIEVIGTGGTNLINLFSGLSGSTVDNQINIQTRGNQAGNEVNIRTRNLKVSGSTTISGSIDISGNLTASLQNGFTYVGNGSGRTQAVSTSSFASNINTGSFLTTASFNAYTESNDSKVNSLINSTGSYATTSSLTSLSASIATTDSAQDNRLNSIEAVTGSYVTSAITGSSLVTASFSGNTLTFTKGDSSTFGVIIPDVSGSTIPAGTVSGSSQITALGFAITGSNTFIGNQTISGSDTKNGINFLTGSSAFFVGQDQVGRFIISSSNQNRWIELNNTNGFAEVYSQTVNFNNSVSLRGNTEARKFTQEVGHPFTINGTLSASLASGYAFVGGGDGYSKQVPTASFSSASLVTGSVNVNVLTFTKGDGSTFDLTVAASGSVVPGTVSGSAQITAFGFISSSGGIDTGSFMTTGSVSGNVLTFTKGDATTFTLAVATGSGATFSKPSVESISGSLLLTANTFTSGAASIAHLSASAQNQANLVFKNNNTAGDTIISGSNNIFVNSAAAATGFKRYFGGSGNIALNSSNIPQISGSMAFSPTMNNNYFGGNSSTITMRGPVSSSTYTIVANNILGTVNVGSSDANNAEKLVSGLTLSGNQIAGTLNIIANKTNLATGLTINNTALNGTATINANSSSISMAGNSINDGLTVNNNFFSGSAGFGNVAINRNNIGGQGHNITIQGTLPSGSTSGHSIGDNVIFGGGNTLLIDPTNSRASGSINYFQAIRNIIAGNVLIVSASSLLGDISTAGSAYFGRYNANDGRRNTTGENVFVVGTGNTTTKKTGFLIDSGSNTFVEGTLNVSGSTAFTGSISIAPTFQAKFATGSNQQAGTAVLDGANPGAVVVSNSLVTADSIILLTKQTLTNAHMVAVSSKGSGTFTITSNGNGDTDTVGWFIINNS